MLQRFFLGRQAAQQDLLGGRVHDGMAADHPLIEELTQDLTGHGLEVRGKFRFGQDLKGGIRDGHPQEPVKFRLVLQ